MTPREKLFAMLFVAVVLGAMALVLQSNKVTGYLSLDDGRVCAVKRNGRLVCPDFLPPQKPKTELRV